MWYSDYTHPLRNDYPTENDGTDGLHSPYNNSSTASQYCKRILPVGSQQGTTRGSLTTTTDIHVDWWMADGILLPGTSTEEMPSPTLPR